ncbi:MAG: response regulator transcription factor [Kineosporiaceae bacterium]
MTHILIAEDEPRIAAFVQRGLVAAGYTTQIEADGRRVVEAVRRGGADLLVLDIGLPGADGFQILDTLRSTGDDVPVVILSARDSVQDTVTGLRLGADDYVRKPFAVAELVARIQARLRPVGRPAGDPTTVTAGGVVLDALRRRASVGGREVELSAREFTLAEALMRRPGEVRTREELLAAVWGYDFDPGTNIVDVYVRYLRRKLGADRIETVRGLGYRFVLAADP